MQRAVVAGFE